MQLTVRTYKDEVREQVLDAIEQIAKGCAIAAGWPEDNMPEVKVRENEFTPATYNNPELTKRLVGVWKKSFGDENVEIVDRRWAARISPNTACRITRSRQ